MGYTTEFTGRVTVTPPLNQAEISYLRQFAQSRRMNRTKGPYYVDGGGMLGQAHDPDIIERNKPDSSQPGLWCQWVPAEDGTAIGWDHNEKFYNSPEWMRYLIDHFLRPDAIAATSGDPQFADFTFDHVANGEIDARGEFDSDVWRLVVRDNEVTVGCDCQTETNLGHISHAW